MDPKKVIRNGRAFGVNEVKADVYYIDKNYNLECYSRRRITPTGQLGVAALKPKTKSLLEFRFRWDEKADELDVDIYRDGKIHNELWDIEGYRGHRTRRVSTTDKIFEAFIKTPKGKVFCGRIACPLHRELELTESIALS